jgi:hypothetical protein
MSPSALPPPTSAAAADNARNTGRTLRYGSDNDLTDLHAMDLSSHTFHSLFDQLGLPSSESEIQRFIAEHRPLSDTVALADASFWTPAQSQFLREEIREDADWAEVVDQLNLALRA